MRQERFAEKVQAAAAKQLVFKADTKPAERLAVYKRFWKVQQHRLLMEHKAGGGGREVANARSLLLDVLLQNIFDQATKQVSGPAVPVTLVAVGGYGRGELCPHSDVDIMFLHAGKARGGKNDPYVAALVESVLYTLWDIGFKVGHSTRTIEEAMQQANADIKNKTALIESRPVAGPVELHEKFGKELLAKCVKGCVDEYVAARVADQQERHEKYGDSPYMQEPNIKEGCGSLRDLQNLLWMAFFKYRVQTLADLRKEGFLEKAEQRDLEQAHDFLLRCRTALHYLTDRASDVILLNIQPKIAAEMGYRQHDVLRRTEEFMRAYYTHARNIFLLTNALAQRMALTPEKPSRLPAVLQRRPKREEIDGFVLVNGVISVAAPATLRQQPLRMLRVFALAQQRNAELSPELQTQLRAHLHLVDRRVQTAPEARDIFLEILRRRGQVGRVLRWMHETGVLGKFLPEFGRLTCLVQHEFFHRYAADEHTLRVIENLDRVVDAEQEAYKGYRRLFLQLEHPEVLYLAVLLHDVGRSANKAKHADESLVAARNVAQRLRLNEDETGHLLLLVKEHTKLAVLSQRRDIDDQATIDAAARVVGDQANLDMLLLLTFADSMGTGPQMWTEWKEALLWQLYDRTKHELGGAERARHILAKRIEQLYGEVSKQLAKKLHLEEIYSHFELMPASYYINTSADQIAGHLGLVHKFLAQQQEVDTAEDALAPVIEWHTTPGQSHTRISICTWDRVGLFSKICGAVSSAGLNILSAHIYTRGDQVVLDFFDVCDTNLGPVADEKATRQTEVALTNVLTQRGAVDFEHVLAKMHAARRQPVRLHEARIPTVIEYDNEISASRTVIEIQTEDRLGLLFTLTQTLTSLGLDISFAKISTEKGAAIDTFYVQDQLGQQITDEDRLAAIRTKLTEAIGRLTL